MNKKIEAQFLKLNKSNWNELIDQFDDSSIYQTVEFAQSSKGGKNIEFFVLKIDDEVSAVSVVRIVKIPLLKIGIAFIRWGPLWLKKNRENDIKVFELALSELQKEYVYKRKFILRILSGHFREEKIDFGKIFLKNGYYPYRGNDMTVNLDISLDENTLRSNLHKRIRNKLNKFDKIGIEIEQGTHEDYFDIFLELYKTMHDRKQFKESIEVESFKDINSNLLEDKKMQIFICKYNDVPVAAIIISAIGNSGIYLLGAMNEDGLKISASYYLHWVAIKWLKSQGISWYNLGGIDPIHGKGVYFFKTSWGGKEVTYVGGFEASKNLFVKTLINFLERIKR